MSNTRAEAVEPDPRCSSKGHSRSVGAGFWDESAESYDDVQPFRIPSVIIPVCRTYDFVVRFFFCHMNR